MIFPLILQIDVIDQMSVGEEGLSCLSNFCLKDVFQMREFLLDFVDI